MATAIIGVGQIGSAVARNLVQGGERVVLASKDDEHAAKLASELGDHASSAPVETRSERRMPSFSPSGSTRSRS
jgi:predicted dinucleotide-binding enzyme